MVKLTNAMPRAMPSSSRDMGMLTRLMVSGLRDGLLHMNCVRESSVTVYGRLPKNAVCSVSAPCARET